MAKKTKKTIKKSIKKPAVDDKPEITPYPTAGPRIIEFENKLKEKIEPEKKRGRGRPPRQNAEGLDPGPATIPNEIVKQAIQVPFDLWAISQNLDGLKLTDQEARLLAEPAKALLDYYAPKVPTIIIAWSSLVVAAYSVMRPRLELIKDTRKQKVTSPSESAGTDGQGHGGPAPPISDVDPQIAAAIEQLDQAAGEFPTKIKTQKV